MSLIMKSSINNQKKYAIPLITLIVIFKCFLEQINYQVEVGFSSESPYIPVHHASTKSVVVLITLLIIGALVLRVLSNLFRHRFPRNGSDVHGSARWATEREIRQAGLINKKNHGIYLGAWENPKTKRRYYLSYNGDKNILVFAPSRSGKNVGLVWPTLLSWPGSVVVHDIKGENFALTSGWRKTGLNNLVMKFDPTCGDGTSVRFNPLLEVRIGTDNEVRDAQNIAEILVNPNGTPEFHSSDFHWRQSAKSLLTAAILHVLLRCRDKSLNRVCRLLSNPPFELMSNTCHDPEGKRNWKNPLTGESSYSHPLIHSTCCAMLDKSEDERSGVISTAQTFLELYKDPLIAKNTTTSDFKIIDLMNHDKPVSLYLYVSPADLDRTRTLIRLILNQISTRLMENMKFADGRSVPGYKHRLLLMIDEFPALKRLPTLQTSLAFMAGYGIQSYLVSQDLSQIYNAYGKNESIVSNCSIRIAFAPNKVETADLISRMTGNATVEKTHNSYSGKRTDMLLHNESEGIQQISRPLKSPDEVMRLPEDTALIFIDNMHPIYGRKIKYYEDPVFAGRSRVPPPIKSDKIDSEEIETNFPDISKAERLERAQNNQNETMNTEVNDISIDFDNEIEEPSEEGMLL